MRTVNVDEHLLDALGVQAAQGRLFARGETDRTDPAALVPALAILSHELWQSRVWRPADRRADGGSERPAPRSDRHHAAWRRCHGYPAGHLDAARVDPAQSRGSPRSPPALDRPIEGPRHGGGSPGGTDDAQRTVGRTCRRHRLTCLLRCRRMPRRGRRIPTPVIFCKWGPSRNRSSAAPAGRSGCFRSPPVWCC